MQSFSFWQRWLFVVSVIIAVAGVLMALLSGTLIFEVFNQLIVPVFWDANPVGDSAEGFQKFIYGLLGSTMASWGVFMSFVAYYPFRNKEKWAWNCMVMGTLLWYVLDTGFSIYHKVYVNAVGNTALLVLVMLPVVFTKKHFDPQKVTE